MAFSSGGGGGGRPMADINTTPLVDVMLVLLIIFMITAPLMAHKVKFSVPIPSDRPNPNKDEKPEVITLSVHSVGGNAVQYIWNDEQIDITAAVVRMKTESRKIPQPEFNIKSDDAVPYQSVALPLAMARREGFEKVTLNDLRAQPL